MMHYFDLSYFNLHRSGRNENFANVDNFANVFKYYLKNFINAIPYMLI